MRRSLHEQGHNTQDLRVVARSFRIDDAEQMVLFNALCNSPLVVQYFWSASFSCPAPAPSTTMTSAYGLGAETVGTSALRAELWLHEHPERFVVKPMGDVIVMSHACRWLLRCCASENEDVGARVWTWLVPARLAASSCEMSSRSSA